MANKSCNRRFMFSAGNVTVGYTFPIVETPTPLDLQDIPSDDDTAIIASTLADLQSLCDQLESSGASSTHIISTLKSVIERLSPLSYPIQPRGLFSPRVSELEEVEFRREFSLSRFSEDEKEKEAAKFLTAYYALSVPRVPGSRIRSSLPVNDYLSQAAQKSSVLNGDSQRSSNSQCSSKSKSRRSLSESAIVSHQFHSHDLGSRDLFSPARGLQSKLSSCMAKLGTWSFDVFELNRLSPAPLCVVMTHIYQSRTWIKDNIDISKYSSFVSAIEKKYLKNSYHNNLHAADVVANMYYWFTASSRFRSYVPDDIDFLCSMIAAAVHDVAHPGSTNAFQIATKSKLSLLYNDQSVLEHMHCATAFQVMAKNDFASNLSTLQRNAFRETIITMVLATDMGQHRHHVNGLQDMLEREEFKSATPSDDGIITSAEDRLLFLTAGLHTADIANPTKALPISLEWAKRLFEEFYVQGDRERTLELPVSPGMDRTNKIEEQAQLGFYKFMVLPLFSKWAKAIPEAEICLENLEKSTIHWGGSAAKHRLFSASSIQSSDTNSYRSPNSGRSSIVSLPSVAEETVLHVPSDRSSKVRSGSCKSVDSGRSSTSPSFHVRSPLSTSRNQTEAGVAASDG
uniref:Phosphodiesterase n=1 Tax=Hirondellea gigas TaxID=1518452 RepID=A0A6A7G9I4_9CRUS